MMKQLKKVRAGLIAAALASTVGLAPFDEEQEIASPAPETVRLIPADPPPMIDLSILEPSQNLAALTTTPATAMDTLRSELFRQLKEAIPGRDEDVVFDNLTLPQNFELPEGPWRVDFNFKLPQRGTGTVIFAGAITEAGQSTKRFTGSIVMDRMAVGVQVKRLIRRGEKVGPDDLTVLKARLGDLPSDALSKVEILIDKAARSEIRPGVWLTGKMLDLPELIKSRQSVTMKLRNGPIQITCPGMAKQKGALGDVIRIENTESKKEVMARVISRDVVEVVY